VGCVKFTIMICTYNRHELLEKALASIVDGTAEKPDEIVIVNAGDSRADGVIEKFRGRHGIEWRVLKVVNKNLAANRNLGLPHCTGDIVAMTDDDAEVFPDWITQMKRAHAEHPEAGAVGGPVFGTNTASLVGKVADTTTFPFFEEARYTRTLPGVNISYKKDAVQRIGPQDEALFRGEDVDYNWRLLKLGYKIYYDPAVKVYHYHRPTFKALLNQHYMYGRAYYLVRRKWTEMYCIYPRGFKTPKDFLKAGNCAASFIYQPFLSAANLGKWKDRIAALPLLFMLGVAWKAGMFVQWRKSARESA
jgi:GT2 family glycosyltransferase